MSNQENYIQMFKKILIVIVLTVLIWCDSKIYLLLLKMCQSKSVSNIYVILKLFCSYYILPGGDRVHIHCLWYKLTTEKNIIKVVYCNCLLWIHIFLIISFIQVKIWPSNLYLYWRNICQVYLYFNSYGRGGCVEEDREGQGRWIWVGYKGR